MSRTKDLGELVGRFRGEMAARVHDVDCLDWLRTEYHVNDNAAHAIQSYFREQLASMEVMPTDETLVVEHFRDELGQQNVVVHSPFGVWVNDAWGMALAERCKDELGFRPRVACLDDGFLLTVPHYAEDGSEIPRDPTTPLAYQQTGEKREAPLVKTQPLDPDRLLQMVAAEDLERLLERALRNAPIFGVHFRHNAVRSLLVLREYQGRGTPVWLQQLRANEIYEACRDQHDFPPVAETLRECLNEALDLPGLCEVLADLRSGEIRVHVHEAEIPSPFSHSLLTMGTYFDMGRVPARERQSRLMHLHKEILRKVLSEEELRDLLDPEVVERVDRRLQHLLPERHSRDADEMARMLKDLGDLSDESDLSDGSDAGLSLAARTQGDWHALLWELVDRRRALCVPLNTLERDQWRWIAAENFGLYRQAFANNWKLTQWEEQLLDFMATSRPLTMLEVAKKAARDGDVRLTVDRLVEAYWLVRLPGEASGRSDRSDGSDRYVLSDLWVPQEFASSTLSRQQARRALLENHLRTHGPVTKYESMDRYAFPMVEVEDGLDALIEAGLAVRGEYVNTKPLPQWCWRSNLEEIHRLTLARLRREMEPATATEFSDYMLRWQHCHPDTRVEGIDGLRQVLRQLQGVDNHVAVWERDLLSGRVVDYAPALLDRLCYSGEVTWRRFGWQDVKRGQIGFCFRDSAKWLPTHPADIDADLGQWDGKLADVCTAVRQFLSGYGAQFSEALVAGTGADEKLVLQALWHLVWTGEATNDSYECLRTEARGEGDPRSRRSSASQAELPTLGRWVATERLVPPPPPKLDAVQRNLDLARQLLRRYGLLCRDMLKREVAMPRWADLYKALKELEMRGEVRRGYFVEDLPGEQYALPEAVELLRAVKRTHAEASPAEAQPMVLLNACDPANVFGTILPLTDEVGQPVKWSRRPQAYVLFRAGMPLLVYHDTVKQLADLSGAEAERAVQRLMELVEAPTAACRHKEVAIKSWNSHPIDVSPARFLLQELGWLPLKKRALIYDGRQRAPHRSYLPEAGSIPAVFERLGKEDAPVKYDERWIVSRAPQSTRGLFRQLLYLLEEVLPEECTFHYLATHCEVRYRDVKCLRPWPKQRSLDLIITQRAWTPPLKIELGADLDDPALRKKIVGRFDAVKAEVDAQLGEITDTPAPPTTRSTV